MTSTSPIRGADPSAELRATDWVFLFFLLVTWPGVAWLLLPTGDEALNTLVNISRSLTYLQSMAITGSVFFLLVVVVRFRWRSFVDLGFRGFNLGNVTVGFLLFVAANILLQLVSVLFPTLGPGPDDFILALLPRTVGERLLWLGLSITAAIGEETIFRGYILTRLYRAFGCWTPAVALSVTGFGLAHLYQGWVGVILTAAYGLLFSLVYIRRQSLWPCIVAHFLQDAIALLPISFPHP